MLFKRVGIAPNPLKEEALQLAGELTDWLAERGIESVIIEEAATAMGRAHLAVSAEAVLDTDLLLVLGGDGTLLRWGRLAAPKGTLLMGINFGQYGFITETHPDHAIQALERILDGKYYVSERVVLKATHVRDGVAIGTYFAMNDVVVSKGPLARMLALHTFISGKFIVTHAADGIIVATPTGSTAYSLSAGGPVVHPDVCVLVITPICPHTLSARSLVVPDSEKVQIIGECGQLEAQMMLTVDGQLGERLLNNDKVEVERAAFGARLLQLEPQSFYEKLQNRLRWGERISG